MSRANARAAAASHHVEKMGPDLGPYFHSLWQHTAWAFTQWEEHEVLFRHSPERIAKLNRAAGTFFFVVQETLWSSVLLELCKLTGPEFSDKARTRQNVTLRGLVHLVAPELRSKVATAVAAAVQAAGFAQPARNKWLAHRDKPTMLDVDAPQFTLGSAEEIQAALDAIEAAINVVQVAYEDRTSFFHTSGSVNGATSLLAVIDRGLKVRDEEVARRFQPLQPPPAQDG